MRSREEIEKVIKELAVHYKREAEVNPELAPMALDTLAAGLLAIQLEVLLDIRELLSEQKKTKPRSQKHLRRTLVDAIEGAEGIT